MFAAECLPAGDLETSQSQESRAGQAQFRTNPDGSVAEIPPERCPDGHELHYSNVIAAHSPRLVGVAQRLTPSKDTVSEHVPTAA